MGFVPGCETDIFISYAHRDNEPLIHGKAGWVDFFSDLLRLRLRVRLGEIDIFRDPQLRNYGQFPDQLGSKIGSSAIFISVLSPSYVDSEWCLRELKEFCSRASSDRIIKVVKTAFEEPAEPEKKSLLAKIKDVLDFRFFERDETTRLYKDLQPEVVADHVPAVIEKVDAIAQNIVELVRKLRATNVDASLLPVTTAPLPEETNVDAPVSVYLAETTSEKELVRIYNEVRSELLQFNYRVLPDGPVPRDGDELIKVVQGHLQQAKLSIHLLGANYGLRPEREERSIPHMQYDLASENVSLGSLIQLVWMPSDISPTEENQRKFVESVRNNSPDFLRTTVEDLKTEILKKLKADKSDDWQDDPDSPPINVSLFCHEQDMDSVRPLFNYLTIEQFFNVKLPLKEASSFQKHKELLQMSDAVLLYYGTADEDWFVNIWRIIQRQSSATRTKPVLAKAIYAGLPPTTEKDLLESPDLMIIKNFGKFSRESLAPFVEKIKTAKGAQG